MNLVRFQGETSSIFYEFDKDSAPLGEGGMGRIYQGFRIDTAQMFQSIVAIKCIKPELVSNPTVIQRAQREASVQLDSPNLIRMYGFFSGAEYNQLSGAYVPTYYIAMERLIGVNLEEVLFEGITTDRSSLVIPLAEDLKHRYSSDRIGVSFEITRSILDGLRVLHQYGFTHRDLDPSNIMLTQDGKTKIIDFGICKRNGGSSYGGASLTQAGQFLGKVAYAAPELILGDLRAQGPKTDIYAVGIILYRLVTGVLPCKGTDQEVMNAHLKGDLNYSIIKDKNARRIIEKATAKNPSNRYATADEFQADLFVRGISSTKVVPNWVFPLSCGIGLALGLYVSLFLI